MHRIDPTKLKHISARKASHIIGVDEKTIVAWAETRNFPLKNVYKTMKRTMRRVSVEDMAAWIHFTGLWGDHPLEDIVRTIRGKL